MLGDFTVTHNTGKDACASWLIWWFLVTRAYAKVVCTAPTARQLGDILWSELAKWHRKSTFADEFVVQKDKYTPNPYSTIPLFLSLHNLQKELQIIQ